LSRGTSHSRLPWAAS